MLAYNSSRHCSQVKNVVHGCTVVSCIKLWRPKRRWRYYCQIVRTAHDRSAFAKMCYTIVSRIDIDRAAKTQQNKQDGVLIITCVDSSSMEGLTKNAEHKIAGHELAGEVTKI